MDTAKDKIYIGDPHKWPDGAYLDFRDKSMLIVREGDKTWGLGTTQFWHFSEVNIEAHKAYQYKRLEDQDG